jgi:trans-aconitate methyltransferase
MGLEFSGEIAELYDRYRHGYPAATLDAIIEHLGVSHHDVAVDLGCGTGQLTIPLAQRTRAVLGVDPETDMLGGARRRATDAGVHNLVWMLGTEQTVPLLRRLLGERSVAVLTVAQALHWIDHRALFETARPLLRDGGGIAVITNGLPLWLQDTGWSRAVKTFLEQWLDTSLTARCGTDQASQRRYANDLQHAGYRVTRATHEWVADLDFEHLAGGILSALPLSVLPRAERRQIFIRELRNAVEPEQRFQERVPVTLLIGHR